MIFKDMFRVILLLSVLLCVSCNDYRKNIEKIIITQKDKNPKQFELSSYVTLEKPSGKSLYHISRLKIRNEKIYILDNAYKEHNLFVFTMKGEYLATIAKIGDKEREYKALCDFDVDDKGNVYLYDASNKKMLVYTSEGEYVKTMYTSMNSDSFSLLGNGGFVFSLLKNASKKGSPKVAVTDASLNIKKTYFEYSESFKDNRKNAFVFRESTKGLLYNRSIDDHLVLLDKENGDVIREFQVDVGKNALPQKFKNDSELLTSKVGDSYDFVYKTPFLISNTIFGNMSLGKENALFSYDLLENKSLIRAFYFSRLRIKTLFLPLFVYNDSIVVSSIDNNFYRRSKDRKVLDPDQVAHLEKGGFILTFFKKKSETLIID